MYKYLFVMFSNATILLVKDKHLMHLHFVILELNQFLAKSVFKNSTVTMLNTEMWNTEKSFGPS